MNIDQRKTVVAILIVDRVVSEQVKYQRQK